MPRSRSLLALPISILLFTPSAHAQGYDLFNGTDAPPRWAATLEHEHPADPGRAKRPPRSSEREGSSW